MDEADLIIERAHDARIDKRVYGIHLLSRLSVLNYIRIADEIKAEMRSGTILDWGCSYGQMSFLLQRRGLRVASYDLSLEEHAAVSPVFPEVMITLGKDPIRIPYQDSTFDAVLSCGVFEHVMDQVGSLAEIRRILRKGGMFFIYNLPQQGSYKEFLLERLHLGYSHERKYALPKVRELLESQHFRVVRSRRTSLLPQNLAPIPQLRELFNRFAEPLSLLDRALSAIPLVNLAAEALELVAQKEPDP
jgi:SAM-dependent methyltransferase